ncbi:3-keto-disaccharide hydrolase [Paenibacillus sp. GCM10023250]|uniref:3-keto-disaccharide hydrolase n=1 Tax=Paenibacillus sp. GCM10023250 TaxID=3252648 RepID=UPI0036157285
MTNGEGFRPLFDGHTLTGWHAVPRLPVPRYPGGPSPDIDGVAYGKAAATSGKWTVEDGAIAGRQDPPGCGYGGYLVSDGLYGDFELEVEARPDWPADTGILVRASALGSQGFQILLDHRRSGNIGGLYGNGIGGFHGIAFTLDAVYDELGRPAGLRLEDPAASIEPLTPDKPALLDYAASGEAFLSIWKWDDWNTFRIRVEGASPRITVHVNGLKIAEMDTAAVQHPSYDAAAVRGLLGAKGHIAFEIHDNDPGMGAARWAPNAACRWRGIRIREL